MMFAWKVSSEPHYDVLDFSMGEHTLTITGDLAAWQLQLTRVRAGVHTLHWTYRKDRSLSQNRDEASIAWVRDVSGRAWYYVDGCLLSSRDSTSYVAGGSPEACQAACVADANCQAVGYTAVLNRCILASQMGEVEFQECASGKVAVLNRAELPTSSASPTPTATTTQSVTLTVTQSAALGSTCTPQPLPPSALSLGSEEATDATFVKEFTRCTCESSVVVLPFTRFFCGGVLSQPTLHMHPAVCRCIENPSHLMSHDCAPL